MSTAQIIALVVVGYLLLRNSGTDLFGGMFGSGAAAPVPVPSPTPAPSPSAAATAHTPIVTGDPNTLASLLIQAANQAGFPGTPSLTTDQWNWFINNAPVLQSAFGVKSPVSDLSEVGMTRDAGGQPAWGPVSALQYTALRMQATAKGLSGLWGLGDGRVVDMRKVGAGSKWTM